jgi:polyisoprenoid-binding protein YceI
MPVVGGELSNEGAFREHGRPDWASACCWRVDAKSKLGLRRNKMKMTHEQHLIAAARGCASLALPKFVRETIAMPIRRRNGTTHRRNILTTARIVVLCLLAPAVVPIVTRAQAPVFVIARDVSTVKFFVKASVALEGSFDKWDATLTFTSPDVSTGVLDIEIQAASVHTGSGMKDGKLKGKDFFDVKNNPVIRFVSNKIVQTGPDTFEVDGDFTIRGVTKPETLALTVTGKGTGSGTIKGTMAFDRKDYGMNSGIPFIKIADRVEVTVDIAAKRVSGPPVALKQ